MRILLVEDDDVIAHELLLRGRARGWFVQPCKSLAAATSARRQSTDDADADFIVLDLGMPDGDGLDWLSTLRAQDRLTPVILLTARDRVTDKVQGLRTGADDYLVKPFTPDELNARIEALQRRGQVSRGVLLHYGELSWLGDEGRAFVSGRRLDLSAREFEVLGLLIRRAPRLLPKRAMTDAPSERNLDVGDSAAELYIFRLRRKLGNSGVTVRTMHGFGCVLELTAVQDART